MDLQALTTQLTRLGRLNFSLCLYGASGTGKSAYARYLADKLGLEVVQRRASDLISCYVGETEQNIAKAFAQAREDKSLLILTRRTVSCGTVPPPRARGKFPA